MSQHDGFIKTRFMGIIYSQRAVDVASCDLGTHRHGIAIGTPPGGRAYVEARVDIHIVAHGKGVDSDSIIKRTESELNALRCFVGEGTHIHILTVAMHPYQLDGDMAQIVK